MKKVLVFFVMLSVSLFLRESQILFAQTKGEVKMEWLSWSHFRFTSPTGKIWLTNPHLDNPDNKTQLEDLKADVILVPNGHRDEIGKAPEIALKTGAKIVAPRELALGYLKMVGKVSDKQLVLASIGDQFKIDGITVRVVTRSMAQVYRIRLHLMAVQQQASSSPLKMALPYTTPEALPSTPI